MCGQFFGGGPGHQRQNGWGGVGDFVWNEETFPVGKGVALRKMLLQTPPAAGESGLGSKPIRKGRGGGAIVRGNKRTKWPRTMLPETKKSTRR